MVNDKPIPIFLDELASKSSTPGGGSAAALMGATGAALVSMVCNLTLGKGKFQGVETEMRQVLGNSEVLRDRLTCMIQTDIDVFNKVMDAYGLPKETKEEKDARSAEIQSALKLAADASLACAHACEEVIELSEIVAEKGNLNVISDAGVAAEAGFGALKSAALNVYINVAGIKDKVFVEKRIERLEKILWGVDIKAEEIYRQVKNNSR